MYRTEGLYSRIGGEDEKGTAEHHISTSLHITPDIMQPLMRTYSSSYGRFDTSSEPTMFRSMHTQLHDV